MSPSKPSWKFTSSSSTSKQKKESSSRHPVKSTVANPVPAAMTIYDHGASTSANTSTVPPPAINLTQYDTTVKPPSVPGPSSRFPPTSAPPRSYPTTLPPYFQAPTRQPAVDTTQGSRFSFRPGPDQVWNREFSSGGPPTRYDSPMLVTGRPTSQNPLVSNHSRGLSTQPTRYDGLGGRSLTHVPTMPAFVTGRAPSSARSVLTTPEDVQMATRQLQFDSLPPQQRAEQERWALSLIGSLGVCPARYSWKRIVGGYRCRGGAHMITDELLHEGKGGIYAICFRTLEFTNLFYPDPVTGMYDFRNNRAVIPQRLDRGTIPQRVDRGRMGGNYGGGR